MSLPSNPPTTQPPHLKARSWKCTLFACALPITSLLLLAGLLILWIASWAQTHGWPSLPRGSCTQFHVRTGRLFVISITCPPEDQDVIMWIGTPSIPGQPGERGFHWFLPGEEDAVNQAIRDKRASRVAGFALDPLPPARASNFWGFAMFRPSSPDPKWTIVTLSIPMWFTAVLLSMPILLAGRYYWHPYLRGRRRLAKGLCPSCGYDLRATTTQCPECGTPSRT